MNTQERIGRLQELLERVQTRARETRDVAAPLAAELAPAAVSAPLPEAAPTPMPENYDPARASLPPPPSSDSPVAYADGPEVETYVPSDDDDDAELEVSTETIDIDIDVDEPSALESGAQPIAQQTLPPAELDESFEAHETTRPPAPAGDDELTQNAASSPPANEIEEPSPSSSRRPIAGEQAAEAYGEESAPRHTPPPESGKQVTAPSVHPASAREPSFAAGPSVSPSAPPELFEDDASEAHTLVGGWREPGLGVPEAPLSPGAPPPRYSAPPVPQPSGTRLSPESVRPALASSGGVAAFEGALPAPRPATLGELLDSTLSL